MLGGERALEIRVLAKHGKGVREIAREVGVSRNTVRRYLRDPEAARYRRRPSRPGKLAAFEGYIAERVAAAAPERLEATVLLRELRERGYAGGYSILKEHLARLRPVAVPEPVVRFETVPGEQMQVDWAVIRRGVDRLSVFVATLGWSRAAYVEFVGDERLETLLSRSAGIGMDLRGYIKSGRVFADQIDPAEMSPGEFVHRVREAVERDGAKVVVIDTVTEQIVKTFENVGNYPWSVTIPKGQNYCH